MIYFTIMIQYSAGDIYRYLTAITGIKAQEKNTVDTDEENKRQSVTGIAGHRRHRGRCRRHRHSGIQHLSVRTGALVPKWVPLFWQQTGSGIGIFVHSSTRMTGCRTVRPFGIQKNFLKVGRPCMSIYGCCYCYT
jgi:hypothetical protein